MIDIKCLASGSKGNAYQIDDGHSRILLEAGIPHKKIQQGLSYQMSSLSGVLITHEHMDHAKAVKDVAKAGINCYMSQGTANALGVSGHRAKIVRAKERFTIGTWAILPFDTQHDAAEPLGFLLANQTGNKLLYATDTYYIKYKFQGLTHIMVEANYSLDILRENVAKGLVPEELKNRLLKSHFSLENVKEFLKANDLSKVHEIHLIHLSDGNSDAERFAREIMELTGKPTYIAE